MRIVKKNTFLRNTKSLSNAFRNFTSSVHASQTAPKVIYKRSEEAGERIHEDLERLRKDRKELPKINYGFSFKKINLPKARRD
jgi:hypothetical protein